MVFLSAHMFVRPLADCSGQGRAVSALRLPGGLSSTMVLSQRKYSAVFIRIFFHREDKQSDGAAGGNLEISVLLATPTLR